MTAQIINLGYRTACRNLEARIAEVKALNRRTCTLLKSETDARRARVDALVDRIGRDVEHLRPSDCEAPLEAEGG